MPRLQATGTVAPPPDLEMLDLLRKLLALCIELLDLWDCSDALTSELQLQGYIIVPRAASPQDSCDLVAPVKL